MNYVTTKRKQKGTTDVILTRPKESPSIEVSISLKVGEWKLGWTTSNVSKSVLKKNQRK